MLNDLVPLNDIPSLESMAGGEVAPIQNSGNYMATFDRPTFSKLISGLKIVENFCNDCDIKDGKLRTKTNDRHSVVCIDFSSILPNKSLALSLMKLKLNLLKTFELDMSSGSDTESSIIIEANDSNFEFSDNLSKMIFRKPVAGYLDNSYLAEDEFTAIANRCTEDKLLFSYNMSAYLKKRIANICEGFQVDSVKFTLLGNQARLTVETKSKDNTSKNSTEIPLNRAVDNKYFMMTNIIFKLEVTSDMNISCYMVSDSNCMCKTTMTHYGIPITIYNIVKLANIS